ncbi:ABC transporter substrate-binding protein [Trinickia sp. EG282A]|uniref:ABC transporter substrate-binding protein n=1 Tax=Trinickia sp. EG282A TaxID=3237013 RepID=UPI0034D313F1
MHARDRRATLAVVNTLAGLLRAELGADASTLWPVLAALLQNHLDGKDTTITALADRSGLARTSARRIVFALKAKGWLQFRALPGSGNRTCITPSTALLARFDRITEQTVRLIISASDTSSFDRFDAETLAPASEIAWPRAAAEGFDDTIEMTLVAYEDPVFDILKRNRPDIERFLGHRLRVLTWPQHAYRRTLDLTLDDRSQLGANAPVLVAIPFPWLAELCGDGRLCELQPLQAGGSFSGADFYDAVWQAGWVDGQLYAIPLQPTLNFLWYRRDLFEAEGLDPPRTFDDVIRCASRLQRPSLERAGITWNAAPGLPLAESFLQILGAQGQMTYDERGVLLVDNESGRNVIEYLRALIPWSPHNLRSMDWTRNAKMFGGGKAAMCYHWSNRYGFLDSHTLLQKGGRIGLLFHPTITRDMTPISPLGGALLAIPSRNGASATERAWQAIETLTSPELMKYFVLHGAAGNARHSVAEDRYVLQRNRVIAVMDELAGTRLVSSFPSAPSRRYHDLTEVLGNHLERLLFGGEGDVRTGIARLQDDLARVGDGHRSVEHYGEE